MGVFRLHGYALGGSKREECSKEAVLHDGDRLLVDGTGLLFKCWEDATAYVPGTSEAEHFLHYAGAYDRFHRACLAFLLPFKRAGVELHVIFDNSIGVRGREA